MIVTDASVIVQVCLSEVEVDFLSKRELIAPALLWSEATSVVHELKWRGRISSALATAALDKLLGVPVQRRQPARLHREAWHLAERFGWAKTYDAEYVALAALTKCRLLTTDARLTSIAGQVVTVIGPVDL